MTGSHRNVDKVIEEQRSPYELPGIRVKAAYEVATSAGFRSA